MITYENPVQLAFNGTTLTFVGPDLDPATPRKHPKDREGDFSDYFLWKEGDSPGTHRIGDINVSGWQIQLRTDNSATNDWWHYVIYSGGACAFQFERKRKGGQWEACAPLSLLHIKLDGEADSPTLDSVGTFVATALFGHKGSTCTVTYNPATRQYVRRCT